jgi:hypothetical protein
MASQSDDVPTFFVYFFIENSAAGLRIQARSKAPQYTAAEKITGRYGSLIMETTKWTT